MRKLTKLPITLLLLQTMISNDSFAQNPFWEKIKDQPHTLDLGSGSENFILPELNLAILKSSQTVSSLKLKGDSSFDYTPDELLKNRARDNFYHLGDINLTIRAVGESSWKRFSSAQKREAIKPLRTSGNMLAAA